MSKHTTPLLDEMNAASEALRALRFGELVADSLLNEGWMSRDAIHDLLDKLALRIEHDRSDAWNAMHREALRTAARIVREAKP